MGTQDTPPIKFEQDEKHADPIKQEGQTLEKRNLGTSTLYGRTDRNITFNQRGSYDDNKFDNAFPGAYLEILLSALRMISMFFRRK